MLGFKTNAATLISFPFNTSSNLMIKKLVMPFKYKSHLNMFTLFMYFFSKISGKGTILTHAWLDAPINKSHRLLTILQFHIVWDLCRVCETKFEHTLNATRVKLVLFFSLIANNRKGEYYVVFIFIIVGVSEFKHCNSLA